MFINTSHFNFAEELRREFPWWDDAHELWHTSPKASTDNDSHSGNGSTHAVSVLHTRAQCSVSEANSYSPSVSKLTPPPLGADASENGAGDELGMYVNEGQVMEMGSDEDEELDTRFVSFLPTYVVFCACFRLSVPCWFRTSTFQFPLPHSRAPLHHLPSHPLLSPVRRQRLSPSQNQWVHV
jgi:hypothetical protein